MTSQWRLVSLSGHETSSLTDTAWGAVPYETVAPDALVLGTLKSSGTLIFGGVVSRTVTRKLIAEVSGEVSELSVALQLTYVVPIGNNDPSLGVQLGVRSSPPAVFAVISSETVRPVGPVASSICSRGAVRTGGVLLFGRTTTGNSTVAVFGVGVAVSLAVQLTILTPCGKRLPDAGVHVGVRLPATRSYADRPFAKKSTVVPAAGPSTVMPPLGTVIVGGVVSTTWMEMSVLPVFPNTSVASQ